MRKLLLILLILVSALWWPTTPSGAKGVADRILISSPALSDDIIVEDDGMLSLLSPPHMKNYGVDAINEPPDIEIGYELQRQFPGGDGYWTLDRAVYYPSTDSRHGYVHYPGSWLEYVEDDGRWYPTRPEAELAMQYVLTHQHLTDYLIAYQTDGHINLLDPATLETIYTLDTGQDEWAYAFNGGQSLDGTKLFFQRTNGAHTEAYYVDLTTHELCSTGAHAFIMPTLDGQHLLFQVGNRIEMRDAQTFELVATLDDLFLSQKSKVLSEQNSISSPNPRQFR
jgi:hypothetical protein